MEVIADTFLDLEYRKNYRLERYFRAGDKDPWAIGDVWYFFVDETRLESVEENVRYLKLVYPYEIGTSWDGNSTNGNDEVQYEVIEVLNNDYVGDNQFLIADQVKVLEGETSNLILQKSNHSVYGKGFGKIEEYRTHIFTKTDGIDPSKDVDSGLVYSAILEYTTPWAPSDSIWTKD